MARGLRSKSARKFRAIKREQVFKPVEDARNLRLSKAEAVTAMAQSRETSAAEKEDVGENGFMEIEEGSNVNDDAVTNNVATAGPISRTHNKNGGKWKGKGKGKGRGKKTKDKKSALLVHFRRK